MLGEVNVDVFFFLEKSEEKLYCAKSFGSISSGSLGTENFVVFSYFRRNDRTYKPLAS